MSETRRPGVSRRVVLGSMSALPLVAIHTRPANAAEFSFKLATGQSLTQPINARLGEACKRIQEATGGRVEIKFFPASQLGSDTDLLTQVRTGGVEFLNIAASVISTVAAPVGITNVGFAFKDYGQVWPAIDGPLGKVVRSTVEKAGMVIVSRAGDNSFRKITSSSKPILSPADLDGYRIRVPVSPIFTSLFKALGAMPTSINFNELYSALQTRLVDGQENGLVAIDSGKLYEVQKFVSETNHIWDPFWLLGNRRAFGSLPDDLKTVVVREFDRANLEQREDVAKLEGTLQAKLVASGLTFHPVDRAPFKAALAKSGYYKEWREKFGADNWKVLEDVTGGLG